MSCSTCLPIDCVQDADFEYSIDRRTQLYGYVWDCPPGAYCFTPGVPVTMLCCDHRVVGEVPRGATLAQAQAALQELVRQCMAYRKACASGGTVDTNGDNDPIDTDEGVTICFSDAVCQTAECPDGTTFRWCLKAGAFMDTSCIAANAYALAEARRLAALYKVCLSDVQRTCCVGNPYTGTIVATGLPLATFPTPNYWEITAGSLPPGVSFETGWQTGLTRSFSGTPTTAGSYAFKVKVTTPNGAFIEKSYSLDVLEITTASPLTDAQLGVFYSVVLAVSGETAPATWEIESGTLPDGLLLDEATGVISGTPETGSDGDYTFTVKVTDANGSTCNKQLQLSVSALSPDLYWSFIGNSLDDLIQTVPLANTGCTATTGKIDEAYQLSPAGAFAQRELATGTIPEITFDLSEDWTISMWFKADTLPTGSHFVTLMALDTDDGGGNTNSLRVLLRPTGAIYAGIGSSSDTFAFVPGTDWHFLTVTYEVSTGILHLRIDNGVLGDLAPATVYAAFEGEFYVSKSTSAAPNVSDVIVDEIGLFFDKDLSNDDFDTLWNSGTGITWPW